MDQDPNFLSVRELKSLISKYGGHDLLPLDTVKKQEYVKIFKNLALSLNSKQKEEIYESSEEGSSEEYETESESEEEIFQEKPKKRQSIKSTKQKEKKIVTEQRKLQKTPNQKQKKNYSFTEKKRPQKRDKYFLNNNSVLANKYYTDQKQNNRNKDIQKQVYSESGSGSGITSEGEINIESSEEDDNEEEERGWKKYENISNTNSNITKNEIILNQQKQAGPQKTNNFLKKQNANNKSRSKNLGKVLAIAFIVLLLIGISIVLYGTFHTEKIYYCNSLPEITETAKICTECPLHGVCEYGELDSCDIGYRKNKQKCTPDTEINEILNQEIEDILKTRKIEFHCNNKEEMLAAESLSKGELIQLLNDENNKYDPQLINLWFQNFELNQQEDIAIKKNDYNNFIFTKNPGYPIQCLTKMFLKKYWITLLLFSFLTITSLYIIIRIKQKKSLLLETENIVKKLEDKLKLQKISSKSENINPYLIVNHERDNMINPNHLKKRRTLWPLVIDRIKRDSRIAEKTMKLYGDQVTVWEWIDNIPIPKKKIEEKTINNTNTVSSSYPKWEDN
ncbi:inner nuclear membrane protein heh2-related [Anaeramoeba flamelloides]|uniref:Inner nuclear membrane protein heh2-related n=1 Tax=Anaeramoeba flamelloides TaxID=1746091 RepID=A0AAV7Y7B7_9EUKA|nr:inner nuclear membrane protein heh2-related [Anaeramoeba flamelloides]